MHNIHPIYPELAHGALKAHQPRATVTEIVLGSIGFVAVIVLLLAFLIIL